MRATLSKGSPEQPRLNFKNVAALLVDRDTFTRGLVGRMLRGFGVDNLLVTGTGQEAKELVQANSPDICFVEGALPDMPTAEFVSWLRRRTSAVIRFTPVVVLSGYAQLRLIIAARDGGANVVIRKPVSPKLLFDRINWVAHSGRPFIETTTYVGPDRRFRSATPPDGKLKRSTDIPPDELTIAERPLHAP